MRAGPWFSNEKKHFAYEHKETVHHDNPMCIEGENILKKHLEFGTDNRPLCKECARLNSKSPVANHPLTHLIEIKIP